MGLMEQFRMDGQVAVVTGSGQGIGRGIAWGLADAGCDVVINARRQEDLDVTAEGIRERGQRVAVFCNSIIDRSEELADFTMAELGRIDTWVNNVGGSNDKRTWALMDTPDEVFRSQLEFNLTTAFQGCKAAAIACPMAAPSSTLPRAPACVAHRLQGPYAAAKAGMLNMTETLCLELGPKGIRCNAVSPGPVVTEAFHQVLGVDTEAEEAIAKTVPLGFLGTPDDIAGAVVYLASPAAKWVSGRNILCAGGRTVRGFHYTPEDEEDE